MKINEIFVFTHLLYALHGLVLFENGAGCGYYQRIGMLWYVLIH